MEVQMNKIKIVLISLLFPFFANGQEILGLNDIYQSNDSIVFYVYNQSDSMILFSVSVQEKKSEKWIEISPDIFLNEFSKTTTSFALEAKKMKKISWHTLFIPRVSLNNDNDIKKTICGYFRIVIRYNNYNSSMQKYTYSKDFVVINCDN